MPERQAASWDWLQPACLVCMGLAGFCASGCADRAGGAKSDSPELTAYIQLVMPARIQIERDWTRPVSFAGTRDADGLEVILAAHDAFDDLTKIVGTLHLELYTRRPASADRRDKRIAFWPIALNSRETLTRYWDPLAHFYRIPVRLGVKPLPAGHYILSARLLLPDGRHLFDEYEFAYQAGTALPASTRP